MNKKRNKDSSPHTCNVCKQVLTASGMPSHLHRKHNKLTSDEYVAKYGEFRKKYLQFQSKVELAGEKYICKDCGFKAYSHKQLVQHINSNHTSWEDYYIKYYFNGQWPTCKCGCGQKVKLIKSGKDDRGNLTYARSYITGHDTKTRQTGYRANSYEQRMKMRQSAIKRLQKGESTFHQSGPSKAEDEIVRFLTSLDLSIEQSNKLILNGQEVDILIPNKNIGIEYNGTYFHSDIFKSRMYHLNKTKELSLKGYRLIHIWEPDWYYKSDIIKSMLKQICGKTLNKLYARNTEVREISREQANDFFSTNHLQGFAVGRVYIGLFYKQELVSAMSFSKLRKATGLSHKDSAYELLRFCSRLNTNVVGAASKMFSYFIKTYVPTTIISYANRDWSIGTLYKTLGMEFTSFTPPGYFYVKSRKKHSRFQFQKHKLVKEGADPSMTEYEIMMDRGYHRVWDCGNYKYTWEQNTVKR